MTVEVFFVRPTKEHSLMDVSRSIGLAHTSVKKNLRELVKQDLVIDSVERKGKRKFPVYRANRDNRLFREQKMIYNLASLLDSGFIKFMEEKFAPKSIVVFGSYRRGEDIENSDIDVFLECREEEVKVDKFKKKLNREIQLHFKEDFDSYSAELKNNIINGIVVSGFLEGYE